MLDSLQIRLGQLQRLAGLLDGGGGALVDDRHLPAERGAQRVVVARAQARRFGQAHGRTPAQRGRGPQQRIGLGRAVLGCLRGGLGAEVGGVIGARRVVQLLQALAPSG